MITWISSYLSDRRQSVRYQNTLSLAHTLTSRVPQGSMLGLHNINHGLRSHFYADDSQIYASCKPKDSKTLKANILQCINDISSWMSSNRLKLNPTKTEFMWCSSPSQRHQRSTMNRSMWQEFLSSQYHPSSCLVCSLMETCQ